MSLSANAYSNELKNTSESENDVEVPSTERIQVTGSRINRTDMETASPVTVISASDIKASGFTSLQDVLSAQPSMAGSSLGANSNNGSGGSATVNLRGMGAQRTLVLLNGRRMVASGTGADSFVDLNTIPVSMIQSIEILKDGASAVYGSDAIAGVVNIITKTDYVGTEVNVSGSITQRGDGETGGVSILHGMDLDHGNLVLGLSYDQRGEISQGDLDFVEEGCSSFVPEGSLGGKVPDGNGGFKDRDTCYDYTKDSLAQTPNEIINGFVSYIAELNSELTWSTDAMVTLRSSQQEMAPQPANIMLETSKLDPKYQYLADGEDEVNYRRRMVDAGNRISKQDTETYRISSEIAGDTDDGSWDVGVMYARNDSKDYVHNSIHAGNMEQSIYDNQDLWFGGTELDQQFLMDEGIMYTESNKGGNEQFVLSAGINGLNEHDIGYAFGVESRYESGYYTPDLITQAGESTAAQQDPTSGDYTVQSLYAEISIPLTDSWAVEVAGRNDYYSTFGNAFTYKLGTTYKFTDDFMIRGVLATGFRAPNVSELFGGNSGSFDYLDDPWGNELDEQILVNYTGNEDLAPEESTSLTFGAVYAINDDINFTVDYWKLDVTDAIARVNVQNEMDQCFSGDMASCNLINITPGGDLSNMTSELTNIGSQVTSGVDFNAVFAVSDETKVILDATYLLGFEEDGIDYTGTINGNTGAYADVKANLTIKQDIGESTSVNWVSSYISSMNYMDGSKAVGSYVKHDISVTHFIDDAQTVSVGVHNIFDVEPETFDGAADMNTDAGLYDIAGRTFMVNYQFKF